MLSARPFPPSRAPAPHAPANHRTRALCVRGGVPGPRLRGPRGGKRGVGGGRGQTGSAVNCSTRNRDHWLRHRRVDGFVRLPASGVVPCPPALLPNPARLARPPRPPSHPPIAHTDTHRDTADITVMASHSRPHPRPSAALLHGLRPPHGCLLSHRTLSARTLHTSYITAAASFPNRPRHGALVRTTPDLLSASSI